MQFQVTILTIVCRARWLWVVVLVLVANSYLVAQEQKQLKQDRDTVRTTKRADPKKSGTTRASKLGDQVRKRAKASVPKDSLTFHSEDGFNHPGTDPSVLTGGAGVTDSLRTAMEKEAMQAGKEQLNEKRPAMPDTLSDIATTWEQGVSSAPARNVRKHVEDSAVQVADRSLARKDQVSGKKKRWKDRSDRLQQKDRTDSLSRIDRMRNKAKTHKNRVKKLREDEEARWDEVAGLEQQVSEKTGYARHKKELKTQKELFERTYRDSYLSRFQQTQDSLNTIRAQLEGHQARMMSASQQEPPQVTREVFHDSTAQELEKVVEAHPYHEKVRHTSDSVQKRIYEKKKFLNLDTYKEWIIGFSRFTDQELLINPNLGLDFGSNFSGGVGLNFLVRYEDEVSLTTSLRAFLRYGFLDYLYAQVEGTQQVSALSGADPEALNVRNTYRQTAAAGLGGRYPFTQKVGLAVEVLHALYPLPEAGVSPFIFRIGINY
ncbi:MAG: hypothetical protein AAGA66_00920 [Bacteroidota bacterium]